MMDKKQVNDVIRQNVAQLSKLSDKEVGMMPAVEAPLPSVDQVKEIISLAKRIIFPDYFNKRQPDETIRAYYIGVYMEELVNLLTKQIAHGLQFCEECVINQTKEQVYTEAERLALEFVATLPEIKRLLYTDVQALFDNDPAAPNYGEVIFCYPCMNAMTHYRIAHKLHELKVPVIPRIITEQAHSKTGIDIHPGAQIGEYFAIDHGTSFKYDEQGNMLNVPRHPIIEDYVTVYSNASILGRITIGHHSTIGGNIWLTHSVPPNSRILQSKAVDAGFTDGAGI